MNGKTSIGKIEDINLLLSLAEGIKAGSLCGLGQTAPNTVITTLRYFREEYEDHIKRHHCKAVVCRGLVSAPCSHTCPAGIDVPRYVRFIAVNKPAEAAAVIREKIPFPFVCGLVCFHPCETKCRRGQLDEPIAIRALKRYAAERDTRIWEKNLYIAPSTDKRVAIIGSGPAGLTAAYYLRKLGHKVTVFEALGEPGGMMRFGIPDYRLPKDILRDEISEIEKIGVEIRLNSRVDSISNLFDQGYHAVFVAIGSHKGLKMGIKGEDSLGVIDAISFLMKINLGKRFEIGEEVAVVGGGNVAIDAARSAVRLGAKKVEILYRRTQAEMPAAWEEIDDALKEGIKLNTLVNPIKITPIKNRLELECIRMQLGKVDSSGRRKPEPIRGSEYSITFDSVIIAVGQTSDIPKEFELDVGPGNIIKVNRNTLETSRKGVFAGGDAILGPASVIEAIATGRQASVSIDKYLGGKGIIDEKLAPPEEVFNPLSETHEERRPEMPVLEISERLKGFRQVELGYDDQKAVFEASRCLRCDLEEHEDED